MRVAHPPPNYNRYRSVMAATEQNLSPPARAPSLAFSLSIDSNPFLYLADKTLHRLVVLLFQGAQKKRGRRIFIIIIVFRGTQALINDELLLEIEIFLGFSASPAPPPNCRYIEFPYHGTGGHLLERHLSLGLARQNSNLCFKEIYNWAGCTCSSA